jgi:hypothetical protein
LERKKSVSKYIIQVPDPLVISHTFNFIILIPWSLNGQWIILMLMIWQESFSLININSIKSVIRKNRSVGKFRIMEVIRFETENICFTSLHKNPHINVFFCTGIAYLLTAGEGGGVCKNIHYIRTADLDRRNH